MEKSPAVASGRFLRERERERERELLGEKETKRAHQKKRGKIERKRERDTEREGEIGNLQVTTVFLEVLLDVSGRTGGTLGTHCLLLCLRSSDAVYTERHACGKNIKETAPQCHSEPKVIQLVQFCFNWNVL